ncbi:hypothetical protein D3C74_332630 [compost metagenome]
MASDPSSVACVPEIRASANTHDANVPPMVLVVFVRPVATAVRPTGAAAAAAAGRAATSAPEPSPATTMFVSRFAVVSWNGRKSR